MLYSTGTVYKIICSLDERIIYIGSTFNQLRHRWQCHKKDYKKYLNGKHHCVSIFPYFTKYGIENFKIMKIKDYECYRENKADSKHLHVYEQLWISKTKECVNKHNPFSITKLYQKDYYEANKDNISERRKDYYETNKERYKATNIPCIAVYNIDFISGGEKYDPVDINAMKGTYWYDPVEFHMYIKMKMKSINSYDELKTNMEDNKLDCIQNIDGLTFLSTVKNNSVDLILTDPPYIISKETGMNTYHNKVQDNNGESVKTEEDWIEFKKTLDKPKEELDAEKGIGWSKENYLKYGSILGKKYCRTTMYGDWDTNFTFEQQELFVEQFYEKLRVGGTCIIWVDIWKISYLKEMLEKYQFKQIRIIEWVKTNPQPINSKTNYLTNSREVALLGVKKGKPTFNSSYDNGIYMYPMAAGKYKFHPTQKNLSLFEELIRKHSNQGDTVMDVFLGGGTTALACKKLNRHFLGCEINKSFFDKFMTFLQEKEIIQEQEITQEQEIK